MKTIAIGNQKGGVAKTTTAVSLAAYFASCGTRCLVIDLDSQGHVAESFGVQTSDGLFRLLNHQSPLARAVTRVVRDNLDIVTNDHTAEEVKSYAMRADFRAYLLSMALEQADGVYDLIILDMPPSSDVLHVSALVASDYLLIPAVMDHLALTGVMTILRTARALGRYPNVVPPALIGVLPTLYERTTNETMDNINRLGQALGDSSLILPPIPRDVRVREASAYGKTIWEYTPSSPAAIGYDNGSSVGSSVKNSKGRVGGYLHLAEIVRTLL